MLPAYIKELNINTKNNSKLIYYYYKNSNSLNEEIKNHFYFFASSTVPKIDSHYINLALNSLCWYWIIWDSILVTFFMLITGIILRIFSKAIISTNFFIGLLVFIVVLIIFELLVKQACMENTKKEIELIVRYDYRNNDGKYNKKLIELIKKDLHCK